MGDLEHPSTSSTTFWTLVYFVRLASCVLPVSDMASTNEDRILCLSHLIRGCDIQTSPWSRRALPTSHHLRNVGCGRGRQILPATSSTRILSPCAFGELAPYDVASRDWRALACD